MFKILAFISRKAGLSAEQFRAYYEGSHVPLIERLTPPMACYRRCYVNRVEPFLRAEDKIDFDVVTEMEFASRADAVAWFEAFGDPDALAEIDADEKKFIDQDTLRVCAVDLSDAA